ncbi:transketolase [Pedobacter cryotolerans]|uniref:Transketolase n=1 Tax=Pedobacter cryotolerans TaxID=2571270 RepID=A0A4U1BV28_9SPHI|nr:transketolase [Pedobacter cryotolerans]TKB96601.1 transketolase [Pedobacter cryotolerans]
MKHTISDLEDIASQVRRDCLRMVHAVQSGHPGASLGCADFFTALYFEVLNHNPEFKMEGVGEDLFFLSNGHISPVWYSVLARSGYFEVSELKTFRKLDSRLQGHPTTHEGLPGVRIASGSLGQGLSVAIGAALGKKLDGDKSLVYALMGDGELQEGQNWEALMFAPFHKVDNLIASVDYNGQQIDGPTEKVLSLENLQAKFESFGWHVITSDGNDMAEIVKALHYAKSLTGKGKPILNLMSTQMGYGVDFMVGTHKWHGSAPSNEQLETALGQLKETAGDY